MIYNLIFSHTVIQARQFFYAEHNVQCAPDTAKATAEVNVSCHKSDFSQTA